MNLVHVKKLATSELCLETSEAELEEVKRAQKRNWSATPFPVSPSINSRVVLYEGDIGNLVADTVVNPTNENFTQLDYVRALAGPELEDYIRQNVRFCSTGHIRPTPGFGSNFSQILHAVPPKFQPKYKTAVETALFHTYFRILETMLERRLRTVVMPVLVTARCSLPLEENLELQLRIIRRMLEKQERHFDRIVVHVNSIGAHKLQFRSYFPASSRDEELACYRLPSSVGGPNGEPLIPERQIRIKSKPAACLLDQAANQSIDLCSGLDLSVVVGKTLFSKMQGDFDKSHLANNLSSPNNNNNKQLVAVKRHHRRGGPLRGCVLL